MYQSERTSKTADLIGLIVAISLGIFYFLFFAAPHFSGSLTSFVVNQDSTEAQTLASLKSSGFIKNISGFNIALHLKDVKTVAPGSYKISTSMNALQVASVLSGKPALIWVVIPPGLRKEETAAILTKSLGWTAAQENEFIHVDTNPDGDAEGDYSEGVYFPDTYLIPASETPADTATRLRAMFQTQFAPDAQVAINDDIKWTTALKIASIIQHEAAGTADMPIISGIIWNRLNAGMPLQIDATVQYARGNTLQGNNDGWWAPIMPADEQIDSPYNTYLNKGLPPTPIDSPGLPAINAALNPASTTCLYYLHDTSGNIHCSDTYAGQQANTIKYLQ